MNIITSTLLLGGLFGISFFAMYHFLNVARDIFKTWYLRKKLLNKINNLQVLLTQIEKNFESLDKQTKNKKSKK